MIEQMIFFQIITVWWKQYHGINVIVTHWRVKLVLSYLSLKICSVLFIFLSFWSSVSRGNYPLCWWLSRSFSVSHWLLKPIASWWWYFYINDIGSSKFLLEEAISHVSSLYYPKTGFGVVYVSLKRDVRGFLLYGY